MSVAKGNNKCSLDHCHKKVHAGGLCAMHYTRNLKTGSTDEPPRSKAAQAIQESPIRTAINARVWDANVFA